MNSTNASTEELPRSVVAALVYAVCNLVIGFLVVANIGPGTGGSSIDLLIFFSWHVAPAFAVVGTIIAIVFDRGVVQQLTGVCCVWTTAGLASWIHYCIAFSIAAAV